MHSFNFQYREDIDQSCFLRFNVMATSIGLFSENSLEALANSSSCCCWCLYFYCMPCSFIIAFMPCGDILSIYFYNFGVSLALVKYTLNLPSSFICYFNYISYTIDTRSLKRNVLWYNLFLFMMLSIYILLSTFFFVVTMNKVISLRTFKLLQL
jgi:hypothetical protein